MRSPRSPILSRRALLAATLLASPAWAQSGPDTELGSQVEPVATDGLPVSLKLEPGLAVPLSEPQSEIYDLGGGLTTKLLFGVGRLLAVGPAVSFTSLPASAEGMDGGTSLTAGATARLARPHDAAPGGRRLAAIPPWVDADLMYVHTGPLERLGFAAAVGASVPIDRSRRFWIGPFVRYFQVSQGDKAGFDTHDAKILTMGLALEVGSAALTTPERLVAVEPAPEPVAPEPVAPEPAPAAEPVAAVLDGDGDGVLDDVDNCPDVAGPANNAGCPPYQRVAVQRDKLEVKEKIAFEWDSARLLDSSKPALDEVVRVLKENPRFRVAIEGHASSDGAEAHNQTLSEQRATAVLDHLEAGGVARDRLGSKGFSSSVPRGSNRTVAGRERNRRVEFVLSLSIVKEGNTP